MSFLKQILFSHFSNNQTWSIIYAQEDALPSSIKRMLDACIWMLEKIQNQIRMRLKVIDVLSTKNIFETHIIKIKRRLSQ